MDELTVKFIIALILIFMGFIVCLVISFGGACLFFCGGLVAGGLPFLKGGKPTKGVPLMILGASICLPAFPLGAWFLENDLRFITPGNLPSISFVYLFGSSPISLTLFLVIFAQILSFRNNWHPRNGEQKIYFRTGKIKTLKNWKNNKLHGEFKHYCTDGRIFYRASFDSGLLTGEIYQLIVSVSTKIKQ